MADYEWKNNLLYYVPSDSTEHCLGGVKVNPSDCFSQRQDALFAAFIAGFPLDGRESDIGKRGMTMPIYRGDGTWYIPMIQQEAGANTVSNRLYLCGAGGKEACTQNRFTDFGRNSLAGYSITFASRFVVSDWWAWSCNCSTEVYRAPSAVGALTDWYKFFGNDARFRLDLYCGFWTGKIDGYRWIDLQPDSATGWHRIHWHDDSPVNRKYYASRPDPIRISQFGTDGAWHLRMEWSTGLGQDGVATSSIGKNGTYKPFDLSCNIKNILPTPKN